MDYKKVASIEFGGEYFQAEFNDAFLNGCDITGSSGTFAGTLTADAVDAVDNINIGGNQVALSFYSKDDSVLSYWDDDGVFRNVMMSTINVDEGGIARVKTQFYAYDAQSDNGMFGCQFRWVVNGIVVKTYIKTIQGVYLGRPSHLLFTNVFPITVGANTFQLQYALFPHSTNAYPRFSKRTMAVDVAYK